MFRFNVIFEFVQICTPNFAPYINIGFIFDSNSLILICVFPVISPIFSYNIILHGVEVNGASPRVSTVRSFSVPRPKRRLLFVNGRIQQNTVNASLAGRVIWCRLWGEDNFCLRRKRNSAREVYGHVRQEFFPKISRISCILVPFKTYFGLNKFFLYLKYVIPLPRFKTRWRSYGGGWGAVATQENFKKIGKF